MLPQPSIEVYGTPQCLWCVRAKDLISSRGLAYDEHHVGKDISPITFREMFPGLTKVPQIKINGSHIGGYDELVKYMNENYGETV